MQVFFEKLTRGIERVLALAFMAAVLLSFVNVVGRYVFGVTVIWADEVQIYVMIWMAFLGAVVVSWRRMHLRMDLLFRMMPHAGRQVVKLAELVTLVVLAGFVVYLSGQYAYTMFKLERVSDVAQMPMWIPHGGVVVGFLLILLIALWDLWGVLTGRSAPVDEGDAP